MKICKVNSLPLKEVIESLAQCFDVEFHENCDEYFIDLPPTIGIGQIRGVNFDNGLGIINYKCKFFKDVRIDFTIDDVHPVKFIYALKGPVNHRFANETAAHKIAQYKCAIVASESNNGHLLFFEKDKDIEIVSLEINRKVFVETSKCELDGISEDLQKLFRDLKADHTYYHEGYYGLEFKTLLDGIAKYENQKLVRKYYLESIGLQIFIKQLIQHRDDKLGFTESRILRINELNRVEELSKYISENLDSELSVANLSKLSGLNPNKLQKAFKYLYHSTVNEYVTTTRLDTAQKLLMEKDLNVSEVVSVVGFKSFSYFSKIFKEKFKISPSLFRDLK
ncbi:helix-turn-helix transcriptional regulator [Bizionia gelidisalsuginis]|uniref:Helix-turn-helix transcriptional regulator n=2 Tax=Bizionia TaxID=283785 RepID=A0A8H2LFM8_9FLAO|nr:MULTISPECIES: AraC family transcriptional regulator [Bizionia]TYB71524.1 helix-turn-helix transcriptional regulator [Bizionia saleffrena]TYC10756.1 helix-turn-helix transcriptional regulator [Bizionia gelidisalsuginis]